MGVCCWHQLPSVLSRRAGRSREARAISRDPVLMRAIELLLSLDWCHLPGDDDALIMRCCLKASFLLHTALPNETGELYRSMVYPCPNRSVYVSVGSPGWWKLVIVQAGVPSWSRWRDAPLVREFYMWSFPCKQTASRWFHGRKMRFYLK